MRREGAGVLARAGGGLFRPRKSVDRGPARSLKKVAMLGSQPPGGVPTRPSKRQKSAGRRAVRIVAMVCNLRTSRKICEMCDFREDPRESPTVPDGPRRSPKIPDGSRRSPIVPDGPRRSPAVPAGPRRSLTVPDSPRRPPAVLGAPRRCQAVLGSSQRHPAAPWLPWRRPEPAHSAFANVARAHAHTPPVHHPQRR